MTAYKQGIRHCTLKQSEHEDLQKIIAQLKIIDARARQVKEISYREQWFKQQLGPCSILVDRSKGAISFISINDCYTSFVPDSPQLKICTSIFNDSLQLRRLK